MADLSSQTGPNGLLDASRISLSRSRSIFHSHSSSRFQIAGVGGIRRFAAVVALPLLGGPFRGPIEASGRTITTAAECRDA